MLKLRKIAVTGGLASGKSTVCKFLKELGATVVSADEIVHQLLSPTTSLGKKILNLLGQDVITNNNFDRKKIAEIVFKDPSKLRQLEALLHPAVDEEIRRQYKSAASTSTSSLFVAEIPLLYEAGLQKWFDLVINVQSKPEIALKRFIEKGGEPEGFLQRMEQQLPVEKKSKKADIKIQNDRDLASLKKQVTNIYLALTQEELFPDES